MNRDKFIAFLQESGAEVLQPTNEYEVVRFRTANGVSVVYNGKRGLKFTGESLEAFEKFQKRGIWQIKRRKEKEYEALKELILKRDGENCFFCRKPTTEGKDRTVEHILSIAHGGNNNPSNLVFACQPCNQAAGSMSIIEKIEYRDSLRGAAS